MSDISDDPDLPATVGRGSIKVGDLLPAMVELASIQLDLMRLMARKPVPAGMVLSPQTRWEPGHNPLELELPRLQERATVLLRWLLDHAKAGVGRE